MPTIDPLKLKVVACAAVVAFLLVAQPAVAADPVVTNMRAAQLADKAVEAKLGLPTGPAGADRTYKEGMPGAAAALDEMTVILPDTASWCPQAAADAPGHPFDGLDSAFRGCTLDSVRKRIPRSHSGCGVSGHIVSRRYQ